MDSLIDYDDLDRRIAASRPIAIPFWLVILYVGCTNLYIDYSHSFSTGWLAIGWHVFLVASSLFSLLFVVFAYPWRAGEQPQR